jgi:8-oxo-dGTP pyrophosphatase MutT (NUDIX family)
VEGSAVRETLELLGAVRDPFSRTQMPGHLTASAIVLDEEREHLLVVWHEGLGRWLQPGGHFEPGDDTPADAARRETLEETGVSLDEREAVLVHVDVHDIPARGPEAKHRHHDLRFAFVVPHDAASILTEGASSGWHPCEAVQGSGGDVSLARALARALDAYAGQSGSGATR